MQIEHKPKSHSAPAVVTGNKPKQKGKLPRKYPDAVEASTSLANSQWLAVSTNTLANDWLYYSDPQWTNYASGFYRIRAL